MVTYTRSALLSKNEFTKRECLYLAQHPYFSEGLRPLAHTQIIDPLSYLSEDLSAMNRSVYAFYFPVNQEFTKDLLDSLKLHCRNAICPEQEVKWIQDLHKSDQFFINGFLAANFQLLANKFALSPTYLLHENLTWTEETVGIRITTVLDLCLSGEVEKKVSLLKELRSKNQQALSQIQGVLNMIRNIEKELIFNFTSWLDNYQSNFFRERHIAPLFIMLSPTTDSHALSKLIANCMHVAINDATKYEIFELKLKNAWGQKKHKIKNSEKVARTYSFSKETVGNLDELAKHRGCSKTDLIEQLINETYEKYMINTKKPQRM